MKNLCTILIFLLGLILGSFLNVVIYRLQRGLSIVFPGSSCPVCKKPIRFYDNIPLLSYILLKGRCRQCGSSISWRYPFVEGLTALCLLALYLKYGITFQFLSYGILILFLIPISFIDIDKGLVLNKLTILCFILGVLLILGFQIETWKNSLFGAIGGGGIIWLMGVLGKMIFRKDSLGFGDVKLLVTIGVYVGFPEVAMCLFLGICIAGVFIFGGLILKKLSLGNTIPFGPFIALGTLVYLIWGPSLVNWYLGWY